MSMQRIYRHRGLIRLFVAYMIVAHGVQIIFPTAAYALTEGPSQPEFRSFEPVSTSQMVDPFTGSFTYNIPLMDVGGYPINLAYHSSGGMDAEASYVGYNWNLGIGALNHNIQATPDDFKGDKIEREFNMKANTTIGATIKPGWELFGKDVGKMIKKASKLKPKLGVYHNNYKGWGFEFGISPSFKAINGTKLKLNGDLELGFKSQSGAKLGLKVNLSYAAKYSKLTDAQGVTHTSFFNTGVGVGGKFSSRKGLQSFSFSAKGGPVDKQELTITDKNGTRTELLSEKKNTLKAKGSISYASPTNTPQLQFPFTSNNFTFEATIGSEVLGAHPKAEIMGYVTSQYLPKSKRELSNAAYGYAYLDQAHDEFTSEDPVSLDFSREGDGPFIQKATPNLAVTRPGFDIFSATGQGVSGNFRAFRDPGMYYDPFMRSNSVDASGGIEFGLGGLFHGGLNIGGIGANSTTGRWGKFSVEGVFNSQGASNQKPDNALREAFNFRGAQNEAHEPYYFKQLGELSVDKDDVYYNRLGKDKLLQVAMKKNVYGKVDMEEIFLDKDKNPVPTITTLSNGTITDQTFKRNPNLRVKRNQTFQMLTAEEARYGSLNKVIRNYPLNTFEFEGGELKYTPIGRMEEERKAHHFSSATVTRNDGMRYVYDIPAYNWKQKEVSFNVSNKDNSSPRTPDETTGLVNYYFGDNSVDNELGKDHLFDATTMPAYAHSYLLTAVLSPDYVDKTGDGISDDDLGQAFQLNYGRYKEKYRWRTPIQSMHANYSAGFESRKKDDKAHYTYGEKEIWYVHSIVSRHYIAEFSYSDRADSYGVNGENGGVSAVTNQGLQKLDKITLYSKTEREELGSAAVPIKVVHFEYNYDLFDGNGGIPNNINFGTGVDEGKLTLKKVYFTYANSNRGKYNPYQFYYADPDHDLQINSTSNPAYGQRDYDRWGNYKKSDLNRPNTVFPFTPQDATTADRDAAAWLLNTIKTPSGSLIKVDYEAHRYAYVQDRRAMEMFDIHGIGKDKNNLVTSNTLFTRSGANDFENFNILFIEVPQGIQDDEEFRKRYLTKADGTKLEDLYFNFRLPIVKKKKNQSFADREKEQLAGFVKVKTGGLVAANPGFAWIEVEEYGIKDKDDKKKVNGIARAGWNFIRQNLPERLFPGSDPGTTGESAIQALGGFFMEMRAMFTGYRRIMWDKHYADQADLSRSWIRLYSPYRTKIGGPGARVKQITTSDEWGSMTNSNALNHSFGQKYDYTTTDPVTGETISSGVATFEPMLGISENPFFEPIEFKKKNVWAENDEYYLTGPIAPYAYPAATVGYSKVKISSVLPDDPSVTISRHGTGYTVKEYYTAKDFPVIFEGSAIDGEASVKWRLLKKLHYSWFRQGYLIKRNNMHGRPFQEQIYSESGKRISGISYYYRTKAATDEKPIGELNNENVPVIQDDGTQTSARIGLEMDFMLDERQQRTIAMGLNMEGNLEAFLVALFPTAIPTVFPSPVFENTRARFIVATKVIDQYGLLDRVVAFDGNAEIETKNVAYDAETGAVLLTQTTNEYKDPIYNFNYPAHWAYEGMGQAYKNIGVEWKDKSINDIANTTHLVKGDELLLVANGNQTVTTEKGWVLDVGANGLFVIDQGGEQIPSTQEYAKIKVIRSGRRNLQATSVGSVATRQDPRNNNGLQQMTTNAEVIGAGAVEFANRWQAQCGTPLVEQICECEELTSAASSLENLMEALALNGQLVNSNVNLTTAYPGPFVGSALEAALGVDPNCTVNWVSTATPTPNNCAQDLTIQFVQNCNGTTSTLATINLQTDPSNQVPLCWEYITSFDDIAAVIADPNACQDDHDFTLNGQIDYCPGGNSDVILINGNVDNFPIRDCEFQPNLLFACNEPGDIINPYTTGILGNWRPVRSYTYLAGRTNGGTANAPTPLMPTEIRDKGLFENYNAFWQYTGTDWGPQPTDWTFTAEATRYIPQGAEIESRNPLDQYSSAVFGYRAQVPIAVGANARNSEIAFANFEVGEDIGINCQAPVRFMNAETALTTAQAHTGLQSLEVLPGLNSVNSPYLFAELNPTDPCAVTNPLNYARPYVMQDCDCAGAFEPIRQKEYLATFWVSGDAYHNTNAAVNTFENEFELVIRVDGTPIPVTDEQVSGLIDGWQRHEVLFTIPNGVSTGSIEMQFLNQGPAGSLYVDDFKVQPRYSSVETFVYHPRTMKLLASLDDNGFATIYQYDKEGQLIGTLQEMENGKQSLNESRNFLTPDFN